MMTRTERAKAAFKEKRDAVIRYSLLVLSVLALASLKSSIPEPRLDLVGSPVEPEENLVDSAAPSGNETVNEPVELSGASLWADSSTAGSYASDNPSRISMDARNANLLDILSVLAIKLDTPIICLEEPRTVTFKVENLAPLTAFQLLLQKEGLDYINVGGNLVVGPRERLQDNFYNRMILTRFNLRYISAKTLRNLIGELGIPLQSVSVDVNTEAIWVQGTPIALGKIKEVIDAVDVPENADPADGAAFTMFVYYLNNTVAKDMAQRLATIGFQSVSTVVLNYPEFTRQLLVVAPTVLEDRVREAIRELDSLQPLIKIPVASASGENAYARLDAQRQLLVELTDIPASAMHISGDLSGRGDPLNGELILWVETTPDNINLIREMIDMITFIQEP
jgi:type II secretory pathway component GspD/PulD (secretin)